MKRLSNGTRVLVADGAHALVFRNEGDAQAPNLKLLKSYGDDFGLRNMGLKSNSV